MAETLTPAPSEPNTTDVVVPQGGDPRTAASVKVPFQALTNMVAWIYGVLTGTVSQVVTLLDGFHGTYGTFSGNLSVNGEFFAASARAVPRSVMGDTSNGVHTYSPDDYNEVLTDAFTPAVASGCVWQISAIGFEGEMMTFATHDAITAITLKSPTGATLAQLKVTTDATLPHEVTCRFDGTFWQVVRERYK
jgi:hypothetical protein